MQVPNLGPIVPGHIGRTGQPLTILMYHAISNDQAPSNVTPGAFRRHMEVLHANFSTVPLISVVEGCSDERRVAVTFDDAYTDFHTTALPILTSLGIPATVFVPSAYVGGWNDWEPTALGLPRRRVMHGAQLRDIVEDGLVDVGSHTMHHVRMTSVNNATAQQEAVTSRAMLEVLVNRPVETFAYPYGGLADFSSGTTRILREAGYRAAVTTHWGTRQRPGDLLRLRRIHLDEHDDNRTIVNKVDGRYDWKTLKRRAVYQLRVLHHLVSERKQD